MPITLLQLGSAVLYATVGICVFLVLLNRLMILRPDSKAKGAFILATFVLILSGTSIFGFFFHSLPWILAPAGFLTLIFMGEVQRAHIRRSCAGSGPVDTIPHSVDVRTPVTTTDLVVHRFELPHQKWIGKQAASPFARIRQPGDRRRQSHIHRI